MASIIISLAVWSILQAAFVRLVIEDFSGKEPSFGGCLSTALSVALPATGMSILIGLGASLGMLLLIVPGVMLYLRWFVSVPVLVLEKTRPLTSMSRSAFLTYGNRWRLFWIYLIILLALQLVVMVLGAVAIALFESVSFVFVVLAMAWTGSVVALSIVMAILGAVCYVGLRVIKEGVSVDALAQAFS